MTDAFACVIKLNSRVEGDRNISECFFLTKMSQKDFISFCMIHFIVFARKVKEMKTFTLGNAFFLLFNASQQPGDLGDILRRIPGLADDIRGSFNFFYSYCSTLAKQLMIY